MVVHVNSHVHAHAHVYVHVQFIFHLTNTINLLKDAPVSVNFLTYFDDIPFTVKAVSELIIFIVIILLFSAFIAEVIPIFSLEFITLIFIFVTFLSATVFISLLLFFFDVISSLKAISYSTIFLIKFSAFFPIRIDKSLLDQ